MNLRDHRLEGDRTSYIESPNHGSVFGSGLPDSIIIHFTAGQSAESSISWFRNPAAKASAHVVVARDGRITQMVPFNVKAWHAGQSAYRGRTGFNDFSIGIEIDNAGALTKTMTGYEAWFGRAYPPEQVIEAVHRNEAIPGFWHRYSEAQIESVHQLCLLLVDSYGIKDILGHEEIAPGRKRDPGPAFPLDKLRERVLHRNRAEVGAPAPVVAGSRGIVAASGLNIRSAPNVGAATVAPPLAQGTPLEILQESSGWYEVALQVRGWVKKDYVQT